MDEDIRALEPNERFCCKQMIDEGWYIERQSNGTFRLNEDYSCHYIANAKHCPFCGKELNKLYE